MIFSGLVKEVQNVSPMNLSYSYSFNTSSRRLCIVTSKCTFKNTNLSFNFIYDIVYQLNLVSIREKVTICNMNEESDRKNI